MHFTGVASFYGKEYTGKTANGDLYDPEQFTAAHPTLPFGTMLRVTDTHTKRSIMVVVTDRGPFTKGRVLDLSLAAARALGFVERGLTTVTAEVHTGAERIPLRTLFSENAPAR
jgi:rare lipoprotein A